MNREQMIEVVTGALLAQYAPSGDDLRRYAQDEACSVVDALVAAGCVPSDELTQAARAVIDVATTGSHMGTREECSLCNAIDALRAAVTPDERNEP